MRRGEAFAWAVRELSAAGVPGASLDAGVLLGHALGEERERAMLERALPLAEAQWEAYRELVQRRASRVPVSQLIGRREFYGLSFSVSHRVLTPRPETEHLVEWALARQPRTALDLGTGSGAIAVALAVNLPRCRVTAVDISPAALILAAGNARAHGVAGRVRLLRGDLLDPVRGRFDLILSNPPYLREDELPTLDPEVREHEPRLALVAGPHGTELHQRILQGAPARLAPGGWLGVEVGAGQAEAVAGLFREAGLAEVAVGNDFSGVGRVVTGRKAAHG